MVFTGTDPEYSVEDYLKAVTANSILNIGPEPVNTPLHQKIILCVMMRLVFSMVFICIVFTLLKKWVVSILFL